MAYSFTQMQSLLRQAGWPESLIVTMAAIGMAESNGRECIVGTIAPGEFSVGLWQINIGSGLKRSYTKQQLCDPLFNAQVALQLYRDGRGFRHWGAYTDGRYKKYIPASQAAYQPGASPVVLARKTDNAILSTNTNVKVLIGAGALLLVVFLIR